MSKKSKHSLEYLEKKELLEVDLDNIKKKHEMKMEELKYMRETDACMHSNAKERMRIKSAEINKTINRKDNKAFMESYWKK